MQPVYNRIIHYLHEEMAKDQPKYLLIEKSYHRLEPEMELHVCSHWSDIEAILGKDFSGREELSQKAYSYHGQPITHWFSRRGNRRRLWSIRRGLSLDKAMKKLEKRGKIDIMWIAGQQADCRYMQWQVKEISDLVYRDDTC